MTRPDPKNPYADFGESDQAERPPLRRSQGEGDATGGVIPYKNPQALTAYYLGLFSLFPLLGLFLAIPAFILGLKGLKNRRENPAVKGSLHAWIGIIMGGLMTLIWGVLAIGLIAVLVINPN